MPSIAAVSESVYKISWFGPGIQAACSGRNYPNSRRNDFLKEIQIPVDSLRRVKQEHTGEVRIIEKDGDQADAAPADGMLTDRKDITLGILTADCVPVFLASMKVPVIGLIHAGWRGLKQEIIHNGIKKAVKHWELDPAQIKIAFGPAIRSCCYEVTEEFFGYFPKHYQKVKSQTPQTVEKGKVDLIAVAREQLLEAGIRTKNIFDSGLCTSCRNDTFFSARKEKGSKERILSVIRQGV